MMRPPASMLIEQTDSTVVLFEPGLPIEVLILGLPQDRTGAVEPAAGHIRRAADEMTGSFIRASADDSPSGPGATSE